MVVLTVGGGVSVEQALVRGGFGNGGGGVHLEMLGRGEGHQGARVDPAALQRPGVRVITEAPRS